MTSITEETETAQPAETAAARAESYKRPMLAHVARTWRRRRASRGRRPAPPRKRPRARRKPKPPSPSPRRQQDRQGPGPAEAAGRRNVARNCMKATGWQPHSVRGFLSGTVGKKMGLTVTSTKGEDGERTYSVKS